MGHSPASWMGPGVAHGSRWAGRGELAGPLSRRSRMERGSQARAMRRGRSSAGSRVDPRSTGRRIERDVSGRLRPRQRAQHLKEEAAPVARATLAMPAGTRRCGAGASRARSQAQLEHQVRDADTTLHDADRRVTNRVRVSPADAAAAVIAAGCCVPSRI